MPRLCERPGCSSPADVAYGFDAEAQVVWLDAFEAAQGTTAGALCRRHADAMVVPLGWMLDDRREPVPRLFNKARMDDLTDGIARPKARRARADKTIELLRSAVLQLTLDELSRDDLSTSGGVRELGPDERVAPATPVAVAGSAVAPAPTAAPELSVVPHPLPADDAVGEVAPGPEIGPELDAALEVAPEPEVAPPLGPMGLELDQSGPMAIVLALVGDETGATARPGSATGSGEAPSGADGTSDATDRTTGNTADDPSEDAGEDAQVLPWQPRFDTEDDLKGLLKPRGRLLSRAFRGITADGA